MIKTFYCHNGACPFQCKTVISKNEPFERLPVGCLFGMYFEPIWKTESFVEGLEGLFDKKEEEK